MLPGIIVAFSRLLADHRHILAEDLIGACLVGHGVGVD